MATEEENLDEDIYNLFTILVTKTIIIGNKLTGKPITNLKGSEYIKYAEDLGKKIIYHTLSARKLFEGYQIIMKDFQSPPTVDFASIFILTRAALESYLTLNYIYISPIDSIEHEFRALCWDYSGCLERSKFPTNSKESTKNMQSEAIYMENIRTKIMSHSYFNALDDRPKKRLIEWGEWRLGKSWSKLAINSGMNESFFNNMYKYLCGYSHSSRLSILQIQQIKNYETQKMQARTAIPILGIVLAKYVYDYVNLIPDLKNTIDFSSEEYSIFTFFKHMGESDELKDFFKET